MNSKLKVGIIGLGMVGEPVKRWFEEFNGYKRGKDLFCYDVDPKKSYKDDVNKADVIFVSVPTPPNPDGSCNTSIVESVVSQIKDGKIVIVKSTVEPGTVQRLQDKYPKKRLIFNPEFLTESQAWEDFISPDRQIVSTTSKSESDSVEVLNLLPRKNFIRPWTSDYSKKSVNTTEAEMGKYASNVFGFIKVVYGNILSDLAHAMTLKYASEKKSGKTLVVNYDNIKDLIAADLRIGPAWLNVDHGNYSGAGGYCLAPNERLFIFNRKKFKITHAKDLNENVVSILGWKNGKVIKDTILISARRTVDSVFRFVLNKGRDISVTADHLMVVSDKNGNLSEKSAKEVTDEDYIPVVLDGLHLSQTKKIYLDIYNYTDFTKERVLVEKVPNEFAAELKRHLTTNEYRDFNRVRHSSIPIQACLKAKVDLSELRVKTGTSGTWIPAVIKLDDDFARFTIKFILSISDIFKMTAGQGEIKLLHI